jgi:hypothetical protein
LSDEKPKTDHGGEKPKPVDSRVGMAVIDYRKLAEKGRAVPPALQNQSEKKTR